ncbi:MAG TPA: hypothetical protein VF815_02415, partial [Myxococcaceae bacterium]
MLKLGKAVSRTRVHQCALGFVVLVLLTGCAKGMPMGGRVMFEAMRYRLATPQESPDTVAARKRAERERAVLERAVAQGCPPWNGGSASAGPKTTFSAAPRIVLALSSGPNEGGDLFGQATHGYNVPGRSPDSKMPWEFFLGNAAHRLIAYMYGVRNPGNLVFYNKESILTITRASNLGNISKLLPNERELRPDIADGTKRDVFEVKPWNENGLQTGRLKLQLYLAALNRPVMSGKPFTGGLDFHGEILIRFAQGQYIWRLEWQTTEPGIVQYRWTRSQQRFESERAAHEARQWVDITEQEMQHYGGWVSQAVEGMVSRREQLATFSGAVGVCVDVIGNLAVGVFSGSLGGKAGTKP